MMDKVEKRKASTLLTAAMQRLRSQAMQTNYLTAPPPPALQKKLEAFLTEMGGAHFELWRDSGQQYSNPYRLQQIKMYHTDNHPRIVELTAEIVDKVRDIEERQRLVDQNVWTTQTLTWDAVNQQLRDIEAEIANTEKRKEVLRKEGYYK